MREIQKERGKNWSFPKPGDWIKNWRTKATEFHDPPRAECEETEEKWGETEGSGTEECNSES